MLTSAPLCVFLLQFLIVALLPAISAFAVQPKVRAVDSIMSFSLSARFSACFIWPVECSLDSILRRLCLRDVLPEILISGLTKMCGRLAPFLSFRLWLSRWPGRAWPGMLASR